MFCEEQPVPAREAVDERGHILRSLGPNAEKVGILHATKKGFHTFILRTSCQT